MPKAIPLPGARPAKCRSISMNWQVIKLVDETRNMIEAYIKVVQTLISAQTGSKKIYVKNTKKGHVHFRASDFKKILSNIIPPKLKTLEYMKNFRTMDFIICETDRFTNIRYINGKTARVITVDLDKYILLKGQYEKKVREESR